MMRNGASINKHRTTLAQRHRICTNSDMSTWSQGSGTNVKPGWIRSGSDRTKGQHIDTRSMRGRRGMTVRRGVRGVRGVRRSIGTLRSGRLCMVGRVRPGRGRVGTSTAEEGDRVVETVRILGTLLGRHAWIAGKYLRTRSGEGCRNDSSVRRLDSEGRWVTGKSQGGSQRRRGLVVKRFHQDFPRALLEIDVVSLHGNRLVLSGAGLKPGWVDGAIREGGGGQGKSRPNGRCKQTNSVET